ncbi:MAG: pantetheine-phosphate adenylyltransferase [Gemmatimonadetes bacterium]|nr:pantetheine-phosphate adenylyltransferase [Gemmatimonadota bacterium]
MRIGVYPGTFDPVTRGHIDIIERSAALFDRLIVGVSTQEGKVALFDREERIGFIRESVKAIDNIEVRPLDGLLVRFAEEIGARTIVRGLRGGTDFDYELTMNIMNRQMAPEVDTLFLMSSPRWMGVSSSLIREIARHGGDVRPYVIECVEGALTEKRDGTEKGRS